MAENQGRMFLRKRKLPPICPDSQKTPLTTAERSKMYREKMKTDPLFLQKESTRKKLAYLTRTQEQIDADKVKNRIRQKRYRDKRKSLGLPVNKIENLKKILTRSEKEKQRDYWKEKQREHRLKISAQKLRRKREKDKVYYRCKENKKSQSRPSVENTESQPWTNEAKRKAMSRLKSHLPRNKEKFAISIASIIKRATPRKREALKDNGIMYTPKSKKKIDFLDAQMGSLVKKVVKTNPKVKKLFIKELSSLKKKRLVRRTSTYLGIREASVSVFSGESARKTRSDAVGEEVSAAISEFFGRPGVSTNLPTAKRIKRDQQERKVLERTYKDLYHEFSEESRDANIPNISLSTFVRNKPANVESSKKIKWYGCLCEVCTNVELKIRALLNLAQRKKSDVKIKDKYEAVSKTLCDRGSSKFHRKECINRNCNACGCDSLLQFFEPLVSQESDTVQYIRWERVKKVYKGKAITQVMPVNHTRTATAVVCELSNEVETLAVHIFNAVWQQDQFSRLVKKVPTSWVVLNMDFSENYSCVQQQEVQSAHWGHNQVTIHPTVAYYECPKEDCNQTVQEALIFVSNDLQHDAGAVIKFASIANDHLTTKRKLKIERMIHLTDGCSAQYKSKTPFCDISYSNEDFGYPTERHFYGSRHGKGPSDGAGAVIKSSARRAVMGQNIVINNAEDLYTFAKYKMEIDGDHLHSMRTVFLVDEGSIEHDRPQRTNTKTLPGTRKLQCIKTVSPLKVQTRNLSCFCVGCTGVGTTYECENSEYIDPWVEHQLQPTEHREQRARGGTIRALGGTRGAQGGTRGGRVGDKGGTRGARGGTMGARGGTRGARGGTRGAQGDRGGTRGARGGTRGAQGDRGGTRGARGGTRGARGGTRGAQGDRGGTGRARGGTRRARGGNRGFLRGRRGSRNGRQETSSESENDDLDLSESDDQDQYMSDDARREARGTQGTSRETRSGFEEFDTGSVSENAYERKDEDVPGYGISPNLHPVQETSFTSDKEGLETLEMPGLLFEIEIDESSMPNIDVTNALISLFNSSEDILSPHGLTYLAETEPPTVTLTSPEDEIPSVAIIQPVLTEAGEPPTATSTSPEDEIPSLLTIQPVLTQAGEPLTATSTSPEDEIPSLAIIQPVLTEAGEPPTATSTSPEDEIPSLTMATIQPVLTEAGEPPTATSTSPEDEIPSLATIQPVLTEAGDPPTATSTSPEDEIPSLATIQSVPIEAGEPPTATSTSPEDEIPSLATIQPVLTQAGEPPTATSTSPEDEIPSLATGRPVCTEAVEPPTTISPSAEDNEVPATASRTTVSKTTTQRFHTGSYITIKCSDSVFPAVVEDWPWVKYFMPVKKRGLWIPNSISHTIIPEDVDGVVEAPDVVCQGSRIYYKFELLKQTIEDFVIEIVWNIEHENESEIEEIREKLTKMEMHSKIVYQENYQKIIQCIGEIGIEDLIHVIRKTESESESDLEKDRRYRIYLDFLFELMVHVNIIKRVLYHRQTLLPILFKVFEFKHTDGYVRHKTLQILHYCLSVGAQNLVEYYIRKGILPIMAEFYDDDDSAVLGMLTLLVEYGTRSSRQAVKKSKMLRVALSSEEEWIADDARHIQDLIRSGRSQISAENKDPARNRLQSIQFELFTLNAATYCSSPKCRKVVEFGEYKYCGACKLTRYCNVECQRYHWNVGHKHRCLKLEYILDLKTNT